MRLESNRMRGNKQNFDRSHILKVQVVHKVVRFNHTFYDIHCSLLSTKCSNTTITPTERLAPSRPMLNMGDFEVPLIFFTHLEQLRNRTAPQSGAQNHRK
eukprot:m.109773 g.109773  ORF g.109773 m.109773 type:complete len:100 (-) comp12853_c0_seq3:6795-7094(-)